LLGNRERVYVYSAAEAHEGLNDPQLSLTGKVVCLTRQGNAVWRVMNCLTCAQWYR